MDPYQNRLLGKLNLDNLDEINVFQFDLDLGHLKNLKSAV